MLRRTALLKAALVACCITPPHLNLWDDAGVSGLLNTASAQSQPPPAVDWISTETHDEYRSNSGTYYHLYYDPCAVLDLNGNCEGRYRNDPLPLSEQHYGEPQTREESGEDWWYGHNNIITNNSTVGYIAAGYTSAPNCWWAGSSYCRKPIPAIGTAFGTPDDWIPALGELETIAKRKGHTRGMVGRFDLDGHAIWCRKLFPGQIWNVIQDSEGNFVVAGVSYTPMWPEDLQPAPDPAFDDDLLIRLNGLPGLDMNDVDCAVWSPNYFPNMGYLCKLSPDGDILWTSFFVRGEDIASSLPRFSELHDVVERAGPNGPEYWVVGNANITPVPMLPKPYMARVDHNGVKLEDFHYEGPNVNGLPGDWPIAPKGLYTSIAVDPATKQLLLAGWYDLPGTKLRALVVKVDPDTDPFLPDWFLDAGATGGVLDVSGGYDPELVSVATGGGFIPDADGTRIILPITANFSQGNGYSGPKVANLYVHGLNMNGDLLWTNDLGIVQAYDLQSDMTYLSDGNVAVVCAKWVDMDVNHDDVVNLLDLPGQATNCLADNFTSAPGVTMDWNSPFGYTFWNTDAYVAKLNPANGNLIWETSWDADPTSTFECTPNDLRNQECVYKITEAPDGGLVISGNTSHNFDDLYLVKLKGNCQGLVEYDFVVTEAVSGSADHSFTLGFDETWASDKNIVGTIIIPDGITLTISNCTIRFADSQQIAWPTRIIVEGGGSLILEEAILTSLDQCPNSMWDGIQLHGQELASQQSYPGIGLLQGYLSAKGSTISNARTGVAVTDGDFLAPLPPKPGSGGILEATDCTFLNNKYDVAFSPYENHTVANPETVLPNFSLFTRCDFVTDGGLPANGEYPNTHVVMTSVRGISFKGCTWRNTLFGQEPLELPSQQGTGISSTNSSFIVSDDCGVLVQGVPCPSQYLTTSAFTNLHRGILATTFDPSRTFSVDKATFTGTNYGIRMEGIQDASITRCTFDVPEPFTTGIVGSTYGVYSDECTGYRIQENAFLTQQPDGDVKKVGLIIKDSGKQYNTFYNNSFENLYTGSIIEGVNADGDDAIGLEVKCNDYGLTDANTFDVALTGGDVRVQKTQGEPIIDQFDQTQWKNPAGNRFSVAHDGSGDPEEDWHVQVTATVVDYFHHQETTTERTKPEYSNDPDEIMNANQIVGWPGKEAACPSELHDGGTKEEKRLLAEDEHGEYEDSKDAYDATKDNGDTYSLLGYVSDPTKSSTQVRNALQSVAPKVSAEVWQAAFERNPAMSAWHITQALLSNSPLQSDALRMVDDYALPIGYANLVYAAQTGEVNILTLLAGAMAKHGGNKAEALADLGRMSWLDSLDLGGALDSLRIFHEALPADNHVLAVGGVLAAQGDYSTLEALALTEESVGDAPERYAVLKYYAQLEQQQGWSEADEVLLAWLSALGDQRDVPGSAWANAWLHALGQELPEEVIVLPESGPKSTHRSRAVKPVQWIEEDVLEVFPNPARNTAFVVFDFGTRDAQTQLRLLDLNGRLLDSQIIGSAQGIATVPLEGLSAGLYILEVLRPEQPNKQARLIVQ
ncbi:MAG: T9SS type A sorting domain-containing protein [Flavobacteriales bacterium]|nr:T9SS type A sorting domain-containing protein [Flavobacteriales bacterium]